MLGAIIFLLILGFGAYLLIGGATYSLSSGRFDRHEGDDQLICAALWPIYLSYLVFCVATLFMIAAFFRLINRLIRKALRDGGSVTIVK
jgi:TRAP-type C4-dicarboxylate transport system permease small subunit